MSNTLDIRCPENITNMQPSAPPYDPDAELIQRLYIIAARYEIQDEFIKAIKMLYNIEIVILIDDSGSMNEQSDSPPTSHPYTPFSRWNEAERIFEHVMFIATALNPNGIDLFFLNRQSYTNIRNIEQIKDIFKTGPSGYTPLITAFNNILLHKANIIKERKLLVMIITDGEPTDYGSKSINEFKKCLQSKPDNVYVSIIACTGDKRIMKYLNDFDNNPLIKNFDVNDDYENEKIEVLAAQDKDFRFSFGDYIVKCMLGSSNKYFDNLDQINIKTCKRKVPIGSCGCFGC